MSRLELISLRGKGQCKQNVVLSPLKQDNNIIKVNIVITKIMYNKKKI